MVKDQVPDHDHVKIRLMIAGTLWYGEVRYG